MTTNGDVEYKVRMTNLMIQRRDGDDEEWSNWCGPCNKEVADFYLHTYWPLFHGNPQLRVVPFALKSEQI